MDPGGIEDLHLEGGRRYMAYLEAPTSQMDRYQVPNTIPITTFGALYHQIWLLGPSGMVDYL